jgi:AbrB family looped-hinge helix DNA binding protein
MRATGIVRRIDDLGRVVVPKEIRRTLRIREGDPLLTKLTETSYDGANPDFMGVSDMETDLQFVSGVLGFAERAGLK